MEATKKDLEYYRKNAEENYLTTPISVLRYISEMEAALSLFAVSERSEQSVRKSCDHACSPSDFYKGGKCDRMGCY